VDCEAGVGDVAGLEEELGEDDEEEAGVDVGVGVADVREDEGVTGGFD